MTKLNVALNDELLAEIKKENADFGFTPSNYVLAAEYLQRLDGQTRINTVYALVDGYKIGLGAVKIMQTAASELAKHL